MKISVRNSKVMHVGKVQKNVVCALNESKLGQVPSFKCLGCTFSEDGKLERKIAARKKNGDVVASQLRSHVFNKKELSCDTKLVIYSQFLRTVANVGSTAAIFCTTWKWMLSGIGSSGERVCE